MGPEPHDFSSRCISHQTPRYFIGLNQLTSPSLLGSFRFRMRLDSTRPAALSLICRVRHGVWKGASRTTAALVRPGVSWARNFSPSARRRFMPA
ncbi:hypothetical protein D3C87_1868060 [compost metagenome]